jgi:predicted nucleic acid-binding protein
MGEIDTKHGQAAVDILADMAIVRHPHQPFLSRLWALRDNFSAYDAIYVALAQTLDAPLLTRDRRLASAAKSHVSVELI